MAAACFNRGKNGMVHGHAYTILGVNEVTVGGKKHRLIKSRNPHGRETYNG